MTDADVDGSHIRTLLLTFFFRHMTDLIKRDNVYIAQPPLYKIKKGRFEQYIKDDREFVKVMVKRASEGTAIRHGENARKIEGPDRVRFMSTLGEYLALVEKVDKRFRNEKLVELLARAELTHRADFTSKNNGDLPEKIAALQAQLKEMADELQIKEIRTEQDEEHHTWTLQFKDSQGAERFVHWELASSPEFRQMMAKYTQIKDYLEPPFLIEFLPKGAEQAKEAEEEEPDAEGAPSPGSVETREAKGRPSRIPREPVEKQTARELFSYIVEQGKKDYQVQRYKGLGEMTATQLWETTMDPERRTLLA